MTILVTGANGQLGNEMRLVSASCEDKYIFTDVVEVEGVETVILDITDLEAVTRVVKENDVKVIVNCAAYTNVDKAEDDADFCALLNAKAPENLAVAAKEAGALLIHVSTDYVFGGDPYNTPCREQAIHASGCDHVIIRTAWLYSEFGRNFVKTMLSLTATKPQLNVVFDQTGTPTYALDLAEAIAVVIADYAATEAAAYPKTGVYHYSNEGVCSWFDFTKMIAEYAGNVECDIQPCHSDEFPSKVKRPAYSVLDKTRIKQTFGIKVPYWTDSLKKCINNLK